MSDSAKETVRDQEAEKRGILYGFVVGAVLVLAFWGLSCVPDWKNIFWTTEAITSLFAAEVAAANLVKTVWWAFAKDREHEKPTKSALDALVPSMLAVSGMTVLFLSLKVKGLIVALLLFVMVICCVLKLKNGKDKDAAPESCPKPAEKEEAAQSTESADQTTSSKQPVSSVQIASKDAKSEQQ